MTTDRSNTRETGSDGPSAQPGLSRRNFVRAAAVAGTAAVAAGAAGWVVSGGPDEFARQPPVRRIVARRTTGAIPREPADAAWQAAPALDIPMLAQNMTTPRVLTPDILLISLRTLHNGNEIGFHLRWADQAVDDVEAMGRFRDSVAVQLPVDSDADTNVMMGQAGRPVHILHWRASWQTEIETGARSVRRAFPNAYSEVTPESVLGEEAASVHYPALYVGNAMASRKRASAVEELVAEGYGTLTSHQEQRAQGRGVLSGGQWSVVIVVPLAGGHNKARLAPGSATRVALAAWDGGAGNRGARKQWSNWIALELEA